MSINDIHLFSLSSNDMSCEHRTSLRREACWRDGRRVFSAVCPFVTRDSTNKVGVAVSPAGQEGLRGPGHQERQPGVRVQPGRRGRGDPPQHQARQPMAARLQLRQSGEVTVS